MGAAPPTRSQLRLHRQNQLKTKPQMYLGGRDQQWSYCSSWGSLQGPKITAEHAVYYLDAVMPCQLLY
jgi:hypothetical protein